MYISLLLNLMS